MRPEVDKKVLGVTRSSGTIETMKRWQFWVGVLISLFFVWISLKGLSLDQFWDAVVHGDKVADQERRRLCLGSAPLPDLAEMMVGPAVPAGQRQRLRPPNHRHHQILARLGEPELVVGDARAEARRLGAVARGEARAVGPKGAKA